MSQSFFQPANMAAILKDKLDQKVLRPLFKMNAIKQEDVILQGACELSKQLKMDVTLIASSPNLFTDRRSMETDQSRVIEKSTYTDARINTKRIDESSDLTSTSEVSKKRLSI